MDDRHCAGMVFRFPFLEKSTGGKLLDLRHALPDRILLSIIERLLTPESYHLDPASVIRILRRCDIHPRRTDDKLPGLHIYSLCNDHSCHNLSWRAVDSVYDC